MDNLFGTKSVDWSLINIWCCGKFFSSVDQPAHTELCHAVAASSHEQTRCRTTAPRKAIEMSAEEEVEIVSPVKEAEYYSKKKRENEKLTNEVPDETYNLDTSDLKDTFVDINYVKGDTRMETIGDDMNMSDEDPLNVSSTEIIGSNYQNSVLPAALEPVMRAGCSVMCEVPRVANCLESNVQIKKPRGKAKLKKPDIHSKLKTNLRIHQNATHSDVLHACDQCDYKARRIVSLKTHVEAAHSGLFYPCEICDYKGTSRVNLKLHFDQHETVTYNCEQFENTNKHKSRLNAHKESTHGAEKRFSCNQCDFKTNWKKNLKLHKESIHEGIIYSCDQCDFEAKQKNYLKLHKQSVHEGVTYSCDQCDYKAKWKRNVKMHKESIHEGITHSCDQCDYESKEKSNFKQHKKSIHEDVTYSCDQCDFKTKWKNHMKVHKKSIHEGVTYSCDQCDFKAKRKRDVKIHTDYKHSGITHSCPLCGNKFVRKDDLKHHVTKYHPNNNLIKEKLKVP